MKSMVRRAVCAQITINQDRGGTKRNDRNDTKTINQDRGGTKRNDRNDRNDPRKDHHRDQRMWLDKTLGKKRWWGEKGETSCRRRCSPQMGEFIFIFGYEWSMNLANHGWAGVDRFCKNDGRRQGLSGDQTRVYSKNLP